MLGEAGDAYLERGLYERLWELLAALPGHAQHEIVLTWRLRVAKRLGRVGTVREAVEAHLAAHKAPDLRALYAATLPGARGFEEAERAYHTAKTFLTLQHYGNALAFHDTEKSLEVFRSLVALTKQQGNPSRSAVAQMMLALPLLLLGRYHEAARWLEQALTTFDEAGVGDWQARLHMLTNWAYARILIGETVGLHDLLQREVAALKDVFPALAAGFRSTLADYLLSQGRARDALAYYLENLSLAEASSAQGRDFPRYCVRDAVHALLHAGDIEQAAALARKHFYLSGEAEGEGRTFARLAQGMVLTLLNPAGAVALLEEACETFEGSKSNVELVSACLYLTRAHLSLGERARAREALARCEAGLGALSDTGFRLLAGPEEAFEGVKTLWRGQGAPLKLTFLGNDEVSFKGTVLDLYPQWREVLALLALHPAGLSLEGLSELLYGEAGNLNTLKATLSKLRRLVPITARALPFRRSL